MIWDVIIIGGGPGGMQAAIAAASEGLQTLVLERDKVGGQIGQTPRLENSVFANGGLTGPEFAKMMREQAERMGVTIQKVEVAKLRRSIHGADDVLELQSIPSHEDRRTTKTQVFTARTVVLAMGNRWSDLDIPGMKEMISAGLVKVGPVDCLNTTVEGEEVAVFGGGPSAGQAIIELAERGADKVHVILRSKLRMPQYLIDRISDLDNVQLHEGTKIKKLDKNLGMLRIALPDVSLHVNHMFACNGLVPATDWLKGTPGLQLDANGRVITRAPSLETAIPNVYAIGDCRAGSTPRVGVAIGDGSMVVTEIWNHFIKAKSCHNCQKILA